MKTSERGGPDLAVGKFLLQLDLRTGKKETVCFSV
ncbi:MAG: hypothetical protein ACJASX_000766 [Limisphaerales bacterium]